jgi:hypothetical protein
MSANEKSKARYVPLRFSEDTYEKLVKYTAKNKITISEAVRRFTDKGLSIESYAAEQDMIRKFLREELEAVLASQMERLIKLQVRTTKVSAAGFFALADMIRESSPSDATAVNIIANAFKEAYGYMKQKNITAADCKKEAAEVIGASKNLKKVSDM